jgi:CRISPR/Cas system-associated exonuclease Cas4 (RecB family)
MSRKRISYHSFTLLRQCRHRYYLQKVALKEPSQPKDYRNAIYGIITQRLFEKFYVEEWFRAGQGAVQKLFDELPGVIREQLEANPCIWEHRSEVEVLERDCQAAIPIFIQTVKKERLIGESNEAEKEIFFNLTPMFTLSGRVDFLIKRKNLKVLLDGKGTKYGDKYLDRDQLVFYALIMFLQGLKVADKHGFWFWRTGEILWQDITHDALENLLDRIKESLFFVQKGNFEATPSSKACKFCPYRGIDCEVYTEWHKENQRKRRKKVDWQTVETGHEGIVEVV